MKSSGTSIAITGNMALNSHAIVDFSFLDQSDFETKYALGPMKDGIRFYVEGIRCGKCVRKLEELPLTVTGLLSLKIEMGKNLAHATVDRRTLSFSQLAKEISNLGFDPIPIEPESSAELYMQASDRSELIRLGVAAACAGNIMSFSFANYLGSTLEFNSLFSWLSFVLYLPVVTYVAWPFYRGAWLSLQQRQVSIDLPMAIASLLGFAFSTLRLFQGQSDIYFDSLSGFLFLILIARFFQNRVQRRFLRPQALIESLQLARVRRSNSSGWSWTPLERLLPGDGIVLHASETLPVDAELVSASAYFSLAWLSGESRPRTFLRGAVVPAGAKLTSGEVKLTSVRPLPETGFGRILDQIQNFSLAQNRIVSIADKWGQWLLGTVLLSALSFLVLYWGVSSEEAVRRSLALIILACPCAMAFGAPLAMLAGLKKSRKRGLVVRSANIFEEAVKTRHIFFDKTGTVTDSELSLCDSSEAVPAVYQKVILSLENESMHPIAFAFRKAFGGQPAPPADGLREVPGRGVSGYIYGKYYELKRNSAEGTLTTCTLFEDHQPLLQFSFKAQIKSDCLQTLNTLRERGYRLYLLSGDLKEAVLSTATALGFKSDEVFYEVDPGAKAQIVSRHPNSMMVGDGVNDSLAMMRAQVGVAVSGGMEAALKSSAVYLTEEGLTGIVSFLDISRETLALVRGNLVLSVFYNLIGGTLALLGYIDPFVAAVLMPVSSGLIVFSTWVRERRA